MEAVLSGEIGVCRERMATLAWHLSGEIGVSVVLAPSARFRDSWGVRFYLAPGVQLYNIIQGRSNESTMTRQNNDLISFRFRTAKMNAHLCRDVSVLALCLLVLILPRARGVRAIFRRSIFRRSSHSECLHVLRARSDRCDSDRKDHRHDRIVVFVVVRGLEIRILNVPEI